jgi:hypothetical protein
MPPRHTHVDDPGQGRIRDCFKWWPVVLQRTEKVGTNLFLNFAPAPLNLAEKIKSNQITMKKL